MTPFQAYRAYVAIKRHFGGDFDYFKYDGKIKLSVDSFERRNDRYHFEKLARQQDPMGLLVACLSRNPDAWVGKVLEEEHYHEYVKNTGSFSYLAERQLKDAPGETFHDVVFSDDMPKAVARGDISLELAAMLDSVTDMTIDWPSMGPSIEKLARRVRKFAPFMRRRVPITSLSSAVEKVFGIDGKRRDA